MKSYSKLALLVVLALFLVLTACTRQASKAPTAVTPSAEASFPYVTQGAVTGFGTQTAQAAAAGAGVVTATPGVDVATLTPAAGGAAAEPTATTAAGAGQAGGGQGPTATTAPAVNTPVVTPPSSYTLQQGEWPICIARRYGLDLGTFFSQNGLNMNSRPAAGTVLKIPTGSSWNTAYGPRSLKAHPTTVSVGAGDTVYSIACAFGDVTPEAIWAVNGLATGSSVKAGTQLKIP